MVAGICSSLYTIGRDNCIEACYRNIVQTWYLVDKNQNGSQRGKCYYYLPTIPSPWVPMTINGQIAQCPHNYINFLSAAWPISGLHPSSSKGNDDLSMLMTFTWPCVWVKGRHCGFWWVKGLPGCGVKGHHCMALRD